MRIVKEHNDITFEYEHRAFKKASFFVNGVETTRVRKNEYHLTYDSGSKQVFYVENDGFGVEVFSDGSTVVLWKRSVLDTVFHCLFTISPFAYFWLGPIFNVSTEPWWVRLLIIPPALFIPFVSNYILRMNINRVLRVLLGLALIIAVFFLWVFAYLVISGKLFN